MESCVSLWNKLPSTLNQLQAGVSKITETGYHPDNALQLCKTIQTFYNLLSSYDANQCNEQSLISEFELRGRWIEEEKLSQDQKNTMFHLFESCFLSEKTAPSSFPETLSVFHSQMHKA